MGILYAVCLRAHLVQLDIAWEDRERNHERTRELIASSGVVPGDLVVLPELFDAGFSLNVQKIADDQEVTLTFLKVLSAEHSCTVQGGRCVRGDGDVLATNRATVCADGELVCDYAKIHPFSFGREPEAYQGGDRVETYKWNGDREAVICPAVCYDLRFPELFREGLLAGAEVFVLGANWPSARHEHWRSLLVARAIENQAYVLGVNRSGRDPFLAYDGGSMVVDPRGTIVSEADGREQVVSVEIDLAEAASWRDAFGAWRDHRLLRVGRSNRPV